MNEQTQEHKVAQSAAEILALGDGKETREVYVPQWKRSVMISTLTYGQVERIQYIANNKANHSAAQKAALANQLMVATSLVQPRFSLEDVQQLWQRAAQPMNALVTEINKLNGFIASDEDAEKATEKAVGAAGNEFRVEPDEALPVHPGPQAGEDGQGA